MESAQSSVLSGARVYEADMITPMARDKGKFIAPGSFFGWDGDTLVVNILGKPSAGKDVIGKPYGEQLKVSVTAKPVGGKATDHMVRFLAPHFGVTAADIEVVFGRMNVNKQLRIKAPQKLPSVFTKGAEQAGLFDDE